MVSMVTELREHREGRALRAGETQGGFRKEVAFEMSLEGKVGFLKDANKKKSHYMRKVLLEPSPEMRRHRYSGISGNLSLNEEICSRGEMVGVDLKSFELQRV